MLLKKNTKVGKVKIILFLLILSYLFSSNLYSDTKKNYEDLVDLNVLDKVSSKSSNITVEIGKEFNFQNLTIKVLKCFNSKFDDDPEITAYIQVKDLNNENNDEVYVFNGWMFSSSPSIAPFDHPVYDIWLISCY